MRFVTAKEMQKIDKWAIEKIGIPQVALMENAGKAIAAEITKVAKQGADVIIVAYKGNNGGDGLVAARHLKNQGFEVSVFLLCKKEEVSGSARTNLDILQNLKIPIYVKDLKKLESLLKFSDVVVDAIFGVGFRGKIEGEIAKAIDLINKYRSKGRIFVVAVDTPSGVNATSGKTDKHTVQADFTVTFAYPKKGLLKYPAVKNVGKLIVADIGIPYFNHKDARAQRARSVQFYLPKRLVWTHKGDYGKVLIVAGSKNMSGAAWLCARAALRSGAGLVYLAVPQSIQKLVAPKVREVITIGLPETMEGTLSLKAFPELKKMKVDAIAIGPGLTTHAETSELVKKIICGLKTKWLIVDADGLNAISDDPMILKKSKSQVVITPHPGEMARLLGKNTRQIHRQRVDFANRAARRWKVHVVLKGAYTVISDGKQSFINSSGNPGMASAGVGDVLTGMLAGLLPQEINLPTIVYLHGLAGDLAVKEKSEYGMIASDLIEKIPEAIKKLNVVSV